MLNPTEKFKQISIVIVCMAGGTNFGACLQSYALQQILNNLGYDTKIWFVEQLRCSIKSIVYYLMSLFGVFNFWIWLRMPKANRITYKIFSNWQRKHYNTIKFFLPLQLKFLVKKTPCFCIGSDQVWNTYHHFLPELFLNFANNKKRISYASSIGTTRINPKYMEIVKDLLLKFDCISVREETGKSVLQSLTGRADIKRVLDPTLLLEQFTWEQFSKNAQIKFSIPKRYMLCYLLANNSNYTIDLNDVKQRYGIEDILLIPSAEAGELMIEGVNVCHNMTPTEFVWLILNATVVCTDSFHASIFSINLNREFVVFKRFKEESDESQNSRLYDILALFNLESRFYDTKSLEWVKPINWGLVSEVLERERENSINYLKAAIAEK